MIKKLYFATTNKHKLREARKILGREIEGVSLEIDEIQSLDLVRVAERKAKDYFERLHKPLFVEDVSLKFSALKALPGVYINDFLKSLGNKGLIALLHSKKDRSALAQTVISYIDETGYINSFIGSVSGKIATEVKGEEGFGWDSIFIPEGEVRTFAEMKLAEKNKYSMRSKALREFKFWLDKSVTA